MSLEAKNDRIAKLEGTLLQTKEAAAMEYQKLHEEKEQMKTVFMEKLKERESELDNLVKLYWSVCMFSKYYVIVHC